MALRQFNEDNVLNKTMQLFWRQGYYGTSMHDITQSTGLKPGSVYHAFGNKEALYIASLDKYAALSQQKLTNAMEMGVGEGIVALLTNMVTHIHDKQYVSCFLVKTQLELSATAPNLAQCASAHLEESKKIYQRFIAQAYGEVNSESYATAVMMAIFGIRVYGYLCQDNRQIQESLKMMLSWLPWDSGSPKVARLNSVN
ncbi:TetR/AcrR family transcriptional regulator [Alteromonas sp. C1M14]|uniref:TetR/AcrR family transcriptional regulator n=1 Tax=Alteromonas sp. C1M14 TaxID=2841567 RepID=UPI001C0857D2|nr:TetR/AcrR family transcriptional regulator [Alteromonas sp. C1M14]MBU2976704.1 TetR/AcrR family transcriptional regulator [Alteromonas sp. C1M14]